MRESLKDVLMRRDGMTEKDALSLISQARDEAFRQLSEGEMPFDICEEWFGLEPDYLDDLLY